MGPEAMDPAAVELISTVLEFLDGPLVTGLSLMALIGGVTVGIARASIGAPLMGMAVSAMLSWSPQVVETVVFGGEMPPAFSGTEAIVEQRLVSRPPIRSIGHVEGELTDGWSLPEPDGKIVDF